MRYRLFFILLIIIACGVPPLQRARTILDHGLKDESVIIRVNTAKGLKSIGDVKGTKVLYEVIRGDDKNGIVAGLAALSDLGEDSYSPVIVELTEHKDPLIRTEAFRVVALMNDERCYDVLKQGTGDKVAKIRKICYQGLGKFEKREDIRLGLQDIDPLVKITAARALGLIGEPGVDNIIKSIMQERTIDIWQQGIVALAELGDTSSIPFFKEQLSNTPWELRLAAAEALLILGQDQGIMVIKEAIETGNPFVRAQAVRILKKHKPRGSYEFLLHAIQDEYINVSISAIEAMVGYREEESKRIFVEMMDAPNPLVKISAAVAYLKIVQ